MKRHAHKTSLAVVAIAVLMVLGASGAGAEDVTVNATVASTDGTRALATTAVLLESGAVDPNLVAGAFDFDVVEVGRLGADWTVTGTISQLTHDGTGPNLPADSVIFTDDGTASAPAITSTSGTSQANAVVPNTFPETGGTSSLLVASAAQDETVLYTDTHLFTSFLKLVPPTGSEPGTYSGTITLTLTQ